MIDFKLGKDIYVYQLKTIFENIYSNSNIVPYRGNQNRISVFDMSKKSNMSEYQRSFCQKKKKRNDSDSESSDSDSNKKTKNYYKELFTNEFEEYKKEFEKKIKSDYKKKWAEKEAELKEEYEINKDEILSDSVASHEKEVTSLKFDLDKSIKEVIELKEYYTQELKKKNEMLNMANEKLEDVTKKLDLKDYESEEAKEQINDLEAEIQKLKTEASSKIKELSEYKKRVTQNGTSIGIQCNIYEDEEHDETSEELTSDKISNYYLERISHLSTSNLLRNKKSNGKLLELYVQLLNSDNIDLTSRGLFDMIEVKRNSISDNMDANELEFIKYLLEDYVTLTERFFKHSCSKFLVELSKSLLTEINLLEVDKDSVNLGLETVKNEILLIKNN
ncbi:hypothetical protein [Carp edema virus]|nr:hypothetical protein [Carp edema virus]